jgi:hypothetical protein
MTRIVVTGFASGYQATNLIELNAHGAALTPLAAPD